MKTLENIIRWLVGMSIILPVIIPYFILWIVRVVCQYFEEYWENNWPHTLVSKVTHWVTKDWETQHHMEKEEPVKKPTPDADGKVPCPECCEDHPYRSGPCHTCYSDNRVHESDYNDYRKKWPKQATK